MLGLYCRLYPDVECCHALLSEYLSSSSSIKLDEVKEAIRIGVDLSKVDSNGLTLLELAISNRFCRSVQLIDLLVEHGADLGATTKNGKTLVGICATQFQAYAYFTLPHTQTLYSDSITPEESYIGDDSLRFIKHFVQKHQVPVEINHDSHSDDDDEFGFDGFEDEDKSGDTNSHRRLLFSSLDANRDTNTVKYLIKLEKGQNLEMLDPQWNNVLLYAYSNNHLEFVKWLLTNYNPNVNCMNMDSNTILHLLAQTISLDPLNNAILQLLLQHNVNLERVDDNGYTPLLLAASNFHTALIKELAQAGANLTAITKLNHTIYHCLTGSISKVDDGDCLEDLIQLMISRHFAV